MRPRGNNHQQTERHSHSVPLSFNSLGTGDQRRSNPLDNEVSNLLHPRQSGRGQDPNNRKELLNKSNTGKHLALIPRKTKKRKKNISGVGGFHLNDVIRANDVIQEKGLTV